MEKYKRIHHSEIDVNIFLLCLFCIYLHTIYTKNIGAIIKIIIYHKLLMIKINPFIFFLNIYLQISVCCVYICTLKVNFLTHLYRNVAHVNFNYCGNFFFFVFNFVHLFIRRDEK